MSHNPSLGLRVPVRIKVFSLNTFSDSIGSRVQYAVATIMVEGWTNVITFGGMGGPGPAVLG